MFVLSYLLTSCTPKKISSSKNVIPMVICNIYLGQSVDDLIKNRRLAKWETYIGLNEDIENNPLIKNIVYGLTGQNLNNSLQPASGYLCFVSTSASYGDINVYSRLVPIFISNLLTKWGANPEIKVAKDLLGRKVNILRWPRRDYSLLACYIDVDQSTVVSERSPLILRTWITDKKEGWRIVKGVSYWASGKVAHDIKLSNTNQKEKYF